MYNSLCKKQNCVGNLAHLSQGDARTARMHNHMHTHVQISNPSKIFSLGLVRAIGNNKLHVQKSSVPPSHHKQLMTIFVRV